MTQKEFTECIHIVHWSIEEDNDWLMAVGKLREAVKPTEPPPMYRQAQVTVPIPVLYSSELQEGLLYYVPAPELMPLVAEYVWIPHQEICQYHLINKMIYLDSTHARERAKAMLNLSKSEVIQ